MTGSAVSSSKGCQIQTLASDIGQAAQKAEVPDPSGKAPPVSIVITREEQDEVALRQLAEIAERRAKAKAAKGGGGERGGGEKPAPRSGGILEFTMRRGCKASGGSGSGPRTTLRCVAL